MMKISLAEFIGGKEADDAYNKLCELTGLKWDAVGTCFNDNDPDMFVFTCSGCGASLLHGLYNESGVSKEDEIKIKYCAGCGSKVIN